MLPALDKEFSRLEQQLDELLALVKPLSDAQQNFKPDPQSWSMLQIFRHLMQSEGQINKYLRKKILGAKSAPKASLWSSLRSIVLNTAMRMPLRYRVPDAIRVDLDEHYVYDQLTADWKALRKEIREFLETVEEEVAKKALFRHPSVGLMSLEQGLTFMQVHIERHTHQVERIMQHKNFPRNNP